MTEKPGSMAMSCNLTSKIMPQHMIFSKVSEMELPSLLIGLYELAESHYAVLDTRGRGNFTLLLLQAF